MDKYRIVESGIRSIEPVRTFEDLEIHHPSRNVRGLRTGRPEDFEPGRQHERVAGDFEEIRRTVDGRTLVKKDFILLDDAPGHARLPAPVAGFVHYRRDKTATVQILDRPHSEPHAKVLAQVLHMDPRSFRIPEGGRVQYGQPLGRMSDTGTPGAIHAHVEVEVDQFSRYIRDIDNGVIAPGRWPGRNSPAPGQDADARPPSADRTHTAPARASARAHGVLEQGIGGPDVRRLQQRLNALGIRDAQGLPLVEDGDFGRRTREAVESFQRDHGLDVDGRVGRDTRDALAKSHGTRITDTRHPDYPLFDWLLGQVQAAEVERGVQPDAHSMSIAAALAVQVRQSGLERVDRIEFNDSARLVRAVHSPTGRWEQELATQAIDTAQASTYSLHAASDRLAEVQRTRQQEAAQPQHQAPALTP